MLKRTLTGVVILLITAGFVLLKQFNKLFFDAFALILMYGSLIEVINAYKKALYWSSYASYIFEEE